MNRSLTICVILTGLLTSLTTPASGQATVAEITGMITDQSGSAVPHVPVVLTETSTNFKMAQQSNEQGVYYARLSPGTYNISASISGFKTFTATGVLVPTGQLLRYDIKLEVGDVQQKVEITAEAGAVVLQKDSAEISTQLAPEIIRGLPSLTRKTYEMIDLSPGVRFPNGLTNRGYNLSVYQPFVSIAGTPGSRGHNYYIDGTNMIYTRIQGDDGFMPSLNPSPESVLEIRVIANNYGAEFGGGHGAAIIVTTKSGTNQFHGQVYDYEQNGSFDSRNFFAKETSPNHYHNYGGTFGVRFSRTRPSFLYTWNASGKRWVDLAF